MLKGGCFTAIAIKNKGNKFLVVSEILSEIETPQSVTADTTVAKTHGGATNVVVAMVKH